MGVPLDAGCSSQRQLLIKLSLEKVIGLGQTLCSPTLERLRRHGGFHGNQQWMSWVLNATVSRNRGTPGHRQPCCLPQVGAIAFPSWPCCSASLFISQNKVIPARPLTLTQEGWLPSAYWFDYSVCSGSKWRENFHVAEGPWLPAGQRG